MGRHRTHGARVRLDSKNWKPEQLTREQLQSELIQPLVRELGYGKSGDDRVDAGQALIVPEQIIGGCTWQRVHVPEIVLYARNRPACIVRTLTADCSNFDPGQLSQIYRYAVHPEVQAPYYCVCNGIDLVLFGTHTIEPVLEVPVKSIHVFWDELCACLAPARILGNAPSPARDLGLHLLRLGFGQQNRFQFQNVLVSSLIRHSSQRFGFTAQMTEEACPPVIGTFELGAQLLDQWEERFPGVDLSPLRKRSTRVALPVVCTGLESHIQFECRLSSNPEENQDEVFLPLLIDRLM